MYNTAELYQLSFVSPSEKQRRKPQIVFTIKEAHLDEINTRLRALVAHYTLRVEEYCSLETTFTLPVPDLFGHIEFGYGRCGNVTTANGIAHLRIELGDGDRLYQTSLTIHLLTHALSLPVDGNLSNHIQQADIQTRCEKIQQHGHAVGGYISPRVMKWLRVQAKLEEPPALKHVAAAMRQTWTRVAPKGFRKYKGECRARLSDDGRFKLDCFGNACDLSIYPDTFFEDIEVNSIQFDCHNLDRAEQQITLLAGFAKLCELARRDEKLEPPLP